MNIQNFFRRGPMPIHAPFLFLTALCLFPDCGFGQSSVITFPGQSIGEPDWPPSSASGTQKQWETVLSQSQPTLLAGRVSPEQLVSELRSLGLPVSLHLSAKEELGGGLLFDLSDSSAPLWGRLETALADLGCALSLQDDKLQIVSLDAITTTQFFTVLIYDVTGLQIDSQTLTLAIYQSIDPDDWYENGGESNLQIDRVNSRDLLALAAPYSTHLKVRKLLHSYLQLSGANPSDRRPKVWLSKSSAVVELPIGQRTVFNSSELASRRYEDELNAGQVGSIGGGFGGGGGVF